MQITRSRGADRAIEPTITKTPTVDAVIFNGDFHITSTLVPDCVALPGTWRTGLVFGNGTHRELGNYFLFDDNTLGASAVAKH